MTESNGILALQPTEWFAEEISLEFYDEEAEIVFLEIAVEIQVSEKNKRLYKE